MNRFIPTVGDGTEVIAAAVTSIVLTVLVMVSTVLTVHADQTEWPATTTAESHDDPAGENGGESVWV